MVIKTSNGPFEVPAKHISHLIKIDSGHTHLVLIDKRVVESTEPVEDIRRRRESEWHSLK